MAAAASWTTALWRRSKSQPHLVGPSAASLLRNGCLTSLTAAICAVFKALPALLSRCRGDGPPAHRVLVLGLDNAGKTALCNMLSYRSGRHWPWREPRPDHHVLHHQVTWRGRRLRLIDPSGDTSRNQDHRLTLWEELLKGRPEAVIFVVDAADAARHGQAQDALHWLLRHPALLKTPVLVLGNKIDLRAAVDTWDLKCNLGLAGLSNEQRQALLGRTLVCRGLPHELRHRIADFHPHQAASPPHGGPLALRMCSLKQKGSADGGLQWLVGQLCAGDRAAQHKGGCLRLGGAVARPFRSSLRCFLACNAELSRQAALLPLHCA